MKKVIIIGATSGIGRELALHYIAQSDIVGITGRREDRLLEIKNKYPDTVYYQRMDVKESTSVDCLKTLIEEMQGMDLIIVCSGIGQQNSKLKPEIELETMETNVLGFSRIVTFAFHYFKKQGHGHIAGISSIAGTKALRQAPAYSSTKRFQTHYLSCLAQQVNKERLSIQITTIKPGFIRTDLVLSEYPLMISLEKGGSLIFKAVEKRKRSVIVPGRWRWIVFFWRIIPSWLWEKFY